MDSGRRKNLSEQVAARIKQLIIDERLVPGDRLPTEQEMADRFGVSRVSVREATKALSFLGIIRAAPRRGLTIGEVDMARVTEYLGFHFALTSYPKAELLQTRQVIESGALSYIADRMAQDGAVFDRLQATIDAAREGGDARQRTASDIAFHHSLLEASGIGPLLVFDDLLQIFFNRFVGDPTGRQWDLATEHHERLIRYLRDGQLDEARQLVATHLSGYDGQLDE